MGDVEAQKRVGELVAVSLYRANGVEGYVRELYKSYETYLKPFGVRRILAGEIPEGEL